MKKMKLLFGMLVMITALGFTACEKDEQVDEDEYVDKLIEEIDKEELIGTWKSVSLTYTENGEQYYGQFDNKTYVLWSFTKTTVTFKSFVNGTENISKRLEWPFKIKDNKIIDNDGEEMKYEIDGNTLTLTYYDEGEKNVLVLKRQ